MKKIKIKEITICLHCGCSKEVVDAQIDALKHLGIKYKLYWNNRIDRHPEMYESYSELINHSVVTSPTEWVILINDRTHPTIDEVEKMISLLENGYACVLLYNVGFMGFSKELIRKIANEVITQYHKGQDEGRKNELANADKILIELNKGILGITSMVETKLK